MDVPWSALVSEILREKVPHPSLCPQPRVTQTPFRGGIVPPTPNMPQRKVFLRRPCAWAHTACFPIVCSGSPARYPTSILPAPHETHPPSIWNRQTPAGHYQPSAKPSMRHNSGKATIASRPQAPGLPLLSVSPAIWEMTRAHPLVSTSHCLLGAGDAGMGRRQRG